MCVQVIDWLALSQLGASDTQLPAHATNMMLHLQYAVGARVYTRIPDGAKRKNPLDAGDCLACPESAVFLCHIKCRVGDTDAAHWRIKPSSTDHIANTRGQHLGCILAKQ